MSIEAMLQVLEQAMGPAVMLQRNPLYRKKRKTKLKSRKSQLLLMLPLPRYVCVLSIIQPMCYWGSVGKQRIVALYPDKHVRRLLRRSWHWLSHVVKNGLA